MFNLVVLFNIYLFNSAHLIVFGQAMGIALQRKGKSHVEEKSSFC